MRKSFIFPFNLLIISAAVSLGMASSAFSIEPVPVKLLSVEDNIKCFVCHADSRMKEKLSSGKLRSFFVDKTAFTKSTHGSHTCTSCHKDIERIPHAPGVKSVDCSVCHYVDNIYGAPATKEDVERYASYQKSVHKKALDAGNPDAPVCQDCHGAHDIVKPAAPASRINRENIPKTCGRCHLDEYTVYKAGIHGEAHDKGVPEAAICTDCHGEHDIFSPKDSRSSISPTTIPETCNKCHKAEKLMSRFGIKVEQYETFRDSYHGKANKFGVDTVASCASCHGYHDIRPPDDPKSSVNVKNLPGTCGKCHKGAGINYSKGKIHVEASGKESGAIYWVALAFKILTFGTITALIVHILLDLLRKALSGRRHGRA